VARLSALRPESSSFTYSELGYTTTDGELALNDSAVIDSPGTKGSAGDHDASGHRCLLGLDLRGHRRSFLSSMLLGEAGCFTLTVEADSEGMGLLRFSGDVASEQLCDSDHDSLVMEQQQRAL